MNRTPRAARLLRACLGAIVSCASPAGLRAEISVADGMTQESTVEPGKTYEAVLHLRNPGTVPAEAKVYQTDYLFDCAGRNFYGKPGLDPRSNAKWISLGQDFLAIPPKETVGLNYTIHVPDDAGRKDAYRKGTYWSLIMVEESQPPPPPGDKEKRVQVGIRQVIRYGVQVVTHLGGTGKSKVVLLRKELVKKDGRRVFELDVQNAGERWIVPDVSLELFDASGGKAGVFRGRKMKIYPGTCTRQDIDLPALAPGKYKGLIIIDGGEDDVFGAKTEISL